MCSGLANSPILQCRVLVSGQRSMPRISPWRLVASVPTKGGAASSRLVVGRPASTYMAPTARRRSVRTGGARDVAARGRRTLVVAPWPERPSGRRAYASGKNERAVSPSRRPARALTRKNCVPLYPPQP